MDDVIGLPQLEALAVVPHEDDRGVVQPPRSLQNVIHLLDVSVLTLQLGQEARQVRLDPSEFCDFLRIQTALGDSGPSGQGFAV